MPLVIPTGYAHVAVELRNDADPDPWYVTFGVDMENAEADGSDIGDICMQTWWSCWRGTMSTDTRVSGCQVVVGRDDVEPIRYFATPSTAMVGQANDQRLPQNCALLIRKNTNVGGRRHRGRMFVPGVLAEEAVNAVGVIGATYLPTYSDYATSFFGELMSAVDGAPGLPMVLLHSTGISDTPSPTLVLGLSIDNVISTQRRRLR